MKIRVSRLPRPSHRSWETLLEEDIQVQVDLGWMLRALSFREDDAYLVFARKEGIDEARTR
jgi:hypothetical protein